MQLLSGVPGHKSFLYIGGGLELVPGEDLYVYANRICPGSFSVLDAQANARTTVMKRLTDAANTYRISFNAVEASTFRLSMLASPEFRFALYTPGATVERYRTQNLQNSLVMLASETGGKAMLNTNGFFPEPEVIEKALFSYYSLAYSPLQPGSKETHDIKIKLKESKRSGAPLPPQLQESSRSRETRRQTDERVGSGMEPQSPEHPPRTRRHQAHRREKGQFSRSTFGDRPHRQSGVHFRAGKRVELPSTPADACL